MAQTLPVVLFGYDCEYFIVRKWNGWRESGWVEVMCADDMTASPFTNKVRLALRVKGIAYCKSLCFFKGCCTPSNPPVSLLDERTTVANLFNVLFPCCSYTPLKTRSIS